MAHVELREVEQSRQFVARQPFEREQVTQAPGVDAYAAGDLLDIAITTTGTFAPITTDVEAYLQVQDEA